jgi:hypothetical protein
MGGIGRRQTAAALAAAFVLVARSAGANGRFPESNQIIFAPHDPTLIVARTTYAILPSRDNGQTWSYLCEDALGLPQGSSQDPELGIMANGALVAALYSPSTGLDLSTNLGCDWSCIGGSLSGQGIADVVVRPDAPDVVLALATARQPADAGGGIVTQVFESNDDGAHWVAIGAPLDPTVIVQTIDVAASDPHRIYVSATRGFSSSRTASLFVSTDDGAHWTERALAQFDPTTEDSIFIGAVDPADPDRVYIRSSSVLTGGQSRLFLTPDQGQSFQVAMHFDVPPQSVLAITGEILGFALSPDGSKVYVGTKEAGLFVAKKADMKFVMTSPVHVQCLATRGRELWACSDAVSGFVVGMSTNDGATFTAKLSSITGLAGTIACAPSAGGPLGCGATANASQCGDAFRTFCQTDDPSGMCSSPVQPKAPSSSHGCSIPGDAQSSDTIAFFGIAALAARSWRRKKHQSDDPDDSEDSDDSDEKRSA